MQSYEKVSGKSPKALLELVIQMRSIDRNFDANKLLVLLSIAQKMALRQLKLSKHSIFQWEQ